MEAQRWLPIESNPEVMNKFLHNLGLPKKWSIHDVYGLDEPLLAMIPQPVLALLLLFPIGEKYEEYVKTKEAELAKGDNKVANSVYYMKQTISNACGTVAMIHAVANNLDQVTLEDGALKKFLEDTNDASAEVRAEKLEGDESICQTHDSVAKEGQTSAPAMEDKVDYHFIAFVQKDGDLYELDGRKSSPVNCGATSNFLMDAAAECRKYMERDPENINFTIVALASSE